MTELIYLITVVALLATLAIVLPTWLYYLIAGIMNLVYAIINVFQGHLGWALYDAAFAGFFFWESWHNRPRGKGKRAMKAIGAKARAALQKVVDSMPKAKPVRQPVLLPART